ncbi:response regulator [Pigmentibacter ruber]|nr:hypothetical protein GTC16762_25450 [Pigmentibacter ruber]
MDKLSFEKELINTFISETKEMLDETEAIFMQLEKNPQDFSHMDKLLRFLHTIKGSAGVVGIDGIVKFTHVFETLLIEIKNKKIELSQGILDTLLNGNDNLKQAINGIDKDINFELKFLHEPLTKIENILHSKNLKLEENTKTFQEEVKKVKGNVLVIDDENEIAEFIKQVIEKENYFVVTKENGFEALEYLKQNEIDVIFTDLKMPKMDGFVFTEHLREINLYIPVILVSGNLDLDYAKNFLRLGVTDFIEKPFKFLDILLVLEKAMKTRNMWKELLKISKACFKTFVYVQKLDTLLNSSENNNQYLTDRQILQQCLDEIKSATTKLLNFEKEK